MENQILKKEGSFFLLKLTVQLFCIHEADWHIKLGFWGKNQNKTESQTLSIIKLNIERIT